MGLESLVRALTGPVMSGEELKKRQEELSSKIRSYGESFKDCTWIKSGEIAGPAIEEAAVGVEFYLTGVSKKLMHSVPDFQAALAVTMVMADKTNIRMLDALLTTAYLRGVAKALELTGATFQPSPEEKAFATAQSQQQDQQPNANEICPHCGEVHGDEEEAGPSVLDVLSDIGQLSRLLNVDNPQAKPAGVSGPQGS